MPAQRRPKARPNSSRPQQGRQALRAIFSRNFTVVSLINLLLMTAYYLMFVTSTGYARTTYGASLSTAGLTAGIMVIGCLVGRFATGNLLSLLGCRIILLGGLLFYSASIAGFFGVPSLALLFVQRLCMGIGVGIIGTATGTIVAYVVPHEHHGLGISLFSMSTVLALALGPFLGIQIVSRAGYAALARPVWASALPASPSFSSWDACRRCATAAAPSLPCTATSTRVWCAFRWWRSSPA